MADMEALRQKIAAVEALIEAHRRNPALYLGQLGDLNVVREHLAALKDELKLECESQAQKGEINRVVENYVRSGYGIYEAIRKATVKAPPE